MLQLKVISCSWVMLVIIMCISVSGAEKKRDPKCLLPMEPGPCRMSLERFYFNSKTNSCDRFTFGGCRGNDNRFGFRKTCEEACLQMSSKANK